MLCIATSPSGRGKTRLSLWESWRRSRLRGFDGLRASKTVNGAETTYQYVGDQLLYENRDGTDIYYYYDSYGTPTAIRYYKADGTSHRFFLATNQLGDIIGIYNASGNLVVKYEYDAWGNIIAETNATGGTPTSLAQYWSEINPFRYRGYYYDAETELYYLQSRYYDAEVGRFLNADEYFSTGDDMVGNNMYAYCYNNPIKYADYSGKVPWAAIIAIAAVALTVVNYITNRTIKEPKVSAHSEGDLEKEGYRDDFIYFEQGQQGFNSNGATLFDLEVGAIKSAVNLTNATPFTQSLVSAKANAGLDLSGVPSADAYFSASVYTCELSHTFDLDLFDVTITFNGYLGGCTAGAELDFEEGKFSFSPPSAPVGYKLEADLDWK